MNSQKDLKALGKKLKEARENKKMTQAQVAEKAGLSVNYYATVERGEENISSTNLLELEKVLGIKLLNI